MRALSFTFMQQALVACLLIAAVAPLVGTFIVQRGQSLVGDGMGHVAFAGVGLAFLVGLHPIVGALALTVLAGLTLYRLQRGGLGGDLALSLIFYGGDRARIPVRRGRRAVRPPCSVCSSEARSTSRGDRW